MFAGGDLAFEPSTTLPNLRHRQGENRRDVGLPAPNDEGRSVRPPGGILIVAALSALSGAIMGLAFGGYLTVAIATLIALPLGIAIGIWMRGLSD